MRKFNRHSLLCLMIMLLSVLIITISFSWFTRTNGSANAHSLELSNVTAVIKSEESTAVTYKSTLIDGLLKVDETAAVTSANTFTVNAGEVQYFTTKVTNNDTTNTNLSLNNLSLSGATGAKINMLLPVKNTANYSSGMVIAEHITVNAGETVNVEWYIYNPTTSAMTIKFNSMPQIDYYE